MKAFLDPLKACPPPKIKSIATELVLTQTDYSYFSGFCGRRWAGAGLGPGQRKPGQPWPGLARSRPRAEAEVTIRTFWFYIPTLVLRHFQSFVVMQHDLFGSSGDLDKRPRFDIDLSRSKVCVSIKTVSHLNLGIPRLKCHRTTKNRKFCVWQEKEHAIYVLARKCKENTTYLCKFYGKCEIIGKTSLPASGGKFPHKTGARHHHWWCQF